MTALNISTNSRQRLQAQIQVQNSPDPAAHQLQTSIIPVQFLPQLTPSSCDREQESPASPSAVPPILTNPQLTRAGRSQCHILITPCGTPSLSNPLAQKLPGLAVKWQLHSL